jgi:hypothetical protein
MEQVALVLPGALSLLLQIDLPELQADGVLALVGPLEALAPAALDYSASDPALAALLEDRPETMLRMLFLEPLAA